MTGLLITLVVLQSLSLIFTMALYGNSQRERQIRENELRFPRG